MRAQLIELTAPMQVLALERRVGGDGLDDVLAIVERALDREVVDVRVVERVHLRLLERRSCGRAATA